MIEDELTKIWQSSPNQERIKFEKSRLMIDVQSSLNRFHKGIKRRDAVETIAAWVVIAVFAFYAYIIPFTLSKIASVLMILWAALVTFRLITGKKHKPSAFTETYLDYLRNTREYLLIQKQIIDSVLTWYILPCVSLVFLFLMGFIGVPGKSTYVILTGTMTAIVGIAIYFLNKRSSRKAYAPRLKKVEELIKVMEEL